jgi:hypothetical protein
MDRRGARWLRHVAIGGVIAVIGFPGASANASCGPYSNVVVGIHLGLAFGGPGFPVKLNYGVTGRFGQETAAFTRLEGFGMTGVQLTAGITQMLTDSAFIEGGATGVVGPFNDPGAGFHFGAGPGSRAGGILVGGSLPLVGDRSFKYVQSAGFFYPRNFCWNPG